MKNIFVALALLLATSGVTAFSLTASAQDITVGSKKFTESVILGEILKFAVSGDGVAANHRRDLGGTRVLWSALL